jgi:hypothetical protein
MCIFILLSPDMGAIPKTVYNGLGEYTVNGFNSFRYHTIIIPTKKKKKSVTWYLERLCRPLVVYDETG